MIRLHIGNCYEKLDDAFQLYDLVIADPPYGGILKSKAWKDEESYARLGRLIDQVLVPGGTAYVWGGIGKYQQRAFFEWLATVERETSLHLHTLITWSKKRAYGTSHNYLFTREECAMLVAGDKPKTFHVPLLDQKRGYAGYDKEHPAKSEFLRRTNVWTDITELFRGKIHDAEKPARLAEVMMQTSSNAGDRILDPFAGSCSTGVAFQNIGGEGDLDLIELTNCARHGLGDEVQPWE